MQGEKKPKLLTVDDVLFYTGGGLQIYEKYCTEKVGRSMRRPWGRDRQPSWGVFLYNGVWLWKDQAREDSGNAIDFVKKLFGLTFQEAMDKIKWDFGLGGKQSVSKALYTVPLSEMNKKPAHISFITMPFQKRHHEFWNAAEVTEDWCKKFNCFAVKSASLNYKKLYVDPKERVFAYYCSEEDKVKLYFPDRKGQNRFLNNVSYHYLWNYSNLDCCDKLIIQKSPKDMIVTTLLYPHVIATQAEHVKIFNEDTVKRIMDKSTDIYIAYGSDDDGRKKSIAITKEFGWGWVNPPNEYLPEVNDFYGLVKKYGLKELENLLKYKKII